MWALLKTFSWQELTHHPWRNAAAVVAVMLGVALAFSVHLINASALDEFSQAARSVSGQADLELRSVHGQFDETLYARIAKHADVALASPVLEVATYALGNNEKHGIRVVGVDALVVGFVAPDVMPLPDTAAGAQANRYALFAPNQVFLNAAAQRLLKLPTRTSPPDLKLQSGAELRPVQVAGSVRASGRALAVMDIGAAQELFGQQGLLSRVDIRLRPGVNRDGFASTLQGNPDWPTGLSLAPPEQAQAQIDNLSRAYRVNLTVLALIALFTGAFLVFSVLSLSVAKRAQQFALLGVLGLSGGQRLRLVLWESLALGVVGSAAGLGLGTTLAALALSVLGGDLGSGFFAGATPHLQWSPWAALTYGAMGVAAAMVGGWWPARAAQALPPAHTLKGLGHLAGQSHGHWISLGLIVLGAGLAGAPAVYGIPVAAYLSVALLLLGGITALPWLIGLVLARATPWVSRRTLPMLAVARARHQRETAAVAVSGVVASLSLAVALTVMVASFRDSVTQWLNQALPADLYVRSTGNLGASNTVFFTPALVTQAARLPGVKTLQAQRQLPLQLQTDLPPVALLARELSDPAKSLPLVVGPLPVPAGQIGVFVSEAVVDLFGAQPGQAFAPLSEAFMPLEVWAAERSAQVKEELAQRAEDTEQNALPPRRLALSEKDKATVFFVAGVWRDYARQGGAIAMERGAFMALTGDQRANDLALWLDDPAQAPVVQQALRTLADQVSAGAGELMEFGTPGQIRAISLRAFDRSFAVTYWLQAVAIGIGLFGIAASFSAQVLARRKEFGLLAHLGLTRRQILTVVAVEGAAWTLMGALAGLGLGLAVSVVLVEVVNPQSFHWTMDLMLPWARLLWLCLAVVLAGTVTAWLAARAAAGQDAVLAVKEDW